MRFADVLDRKIEEIVQPPNLPIGTYIWSVTKHPETAEISNGKFEKLSFLLGCISATDDVDPDELEKYGSVNGTILRKDFLFTTDEEEKNKFDQTLNNVKRFLSHCGVDVEKGSLKEAIAASVGSSVLADVVHNPSDTDDSVVFQNIGRTAPVE